MSFEGYYQIICRAGHVLNIDCYHSDDTFECSALNNGLPCGAPVGWHNLVDETNGEAEGYVEMIPLTEREFRVCDLGHQHIWSHGTFAPATDGALNILAKTAEDSDG